MSGTATLKVFRYDPSIDESPRYVEYEVELDTDQVWTVLKCLHRIDRYQDQIAYDYNCRAGLCGRCGMLVNNEPHLACWARVEAGKTYQLDPLPGFPVIKDLIVDNERAYKRFLDSSVSTKTKAPIELPMSYTNTESPDIWWDDLKDLNRCRECMLCYTVCPVLQGQGKWAQYIGPGAMMQIAKGYIDPEDTSDRLQQAVDCGVFQCIGCGACQAICSAGIKITELNQRLQQEATEVGIAPTSDKDCSYWPLL